jgi:hypothetical protein
MVGVRSLIDKQFEFRVQERDARPDKLMTGGEMRHFSVQVRNRVTKRVASFYFSMGSAIPSSRNVGHMLLSSLVQDLGYESVSDVIGLGYSGVEATRVLKGLDANREKAQKVGLVSFFDGLSEKHRSEIIDGL